jgi:molybdopterin/thiamine biosynthesis adenylyltransferase
LNHIRHSNIFSCHHTSVTLIGCGGIGAATAICLAKMGIRLIELYDPDLVSPENLATQLFLISDVGRPKVIALADTLRSFSDEILISYSNTTFGSQNQVFTPIVISAVDSIASRKSIWESLAQRKEGFYLDARMGAEKFQLFSVDLKQDHSGYADMLLEQNDETTPELPCTQKATMYCSFVAAGIIGATLKKIVMGESVPQRLSLDIPSSTLLTF